MRAAIVFLSCVAVASAGLLAPVAVGGANQYHAQDELGQYSYGYSGGPSSKVESKTADGIVRGAYSYIDGHGLVQNVNYVSDALGFRVAATNLPVGPAPAPAVALAAAPVVRAIAAPAVTYAAAPAVRAIAAPAVTYAAAPALIAPAAHTIIAGQPTYVAKAAPLNNGAVHVASLPLPPIDTPEVQAARLSHLTAKLG